MKRDTLEKGLAHIGAVAVEHQLGIPHFCRRLIELHGIGGHFTGSMVRHVLESVVVNAAMTVHVQVLAGRDPHHIAESEFKAFARAFRFAKAPDPAVVGVPSTKGAL